MREVVFSTDAQTDLIEIWQAVALKDPGAANLVVGRILERTRLLPTFPEMGRRRSDIRPGARSLVERPYLILYDPTGTAIEIVRIVHGARDLRSI